LAGPLLPEPPPRAAQEPLTPALEARVKRLRWSLILVPFTFVAWVRLHRESPGAARLLKLELVLNSVQSAIVVLLLALTGGLLVFRQAIIDALARWLVDSGLVP
jgi:hypothetical protein